MGGWIRELTLIRWPGLAFCGQTTDWKSCRVAVGSASVISIGLDCSFPLSASSSLSRAVNAFISR